MTETTNRQPGDRTDTKQAWDEVGAGCTDLGGKLRRHFAQVKEEDGAQAADALRKLVAAVGDAFEAVGDAARDPEVRIEARKVAGSLTEALGSTFAGVGGEVRKVFAKARGGTDTAVHTDTAHTGAGATDTGAAWAPPTGPAADTADAPPAGHAPG